MSGLRIVIADDDPLLALSLRTELEDMGHEVVGEARNGAEAAQLVEQLAPDIIVMDIRMPVVDGLAASQKIMERRPTPIVLVSSYSEPDLIQEADDIGVQAYLVKPVESLELRPAIQIALSRFRKLKELQEIARTDELTGLENRRSLMEDLPSLLSSAQRYDFAVSVILFDLNGFKAVNDTLGHDAGDEALRSVARVLRTAARESDRHYRLGGDEFVLVLSHTDRLGADRAARRYQSAITSLELPQNLRLGASMGVVTFPDDGTDVEMLLSLADRRMYRAKRAHKNSLAPTGTISQPPTPMVG